MKICIFFFFFDSRISYSSNIHQMVHYVLRSRLNNNINQLFTRFHFTVLFFVFKKINTRDSLIDIFLSCFNLLHILNYIEKRFFVLIIILHSKRTKTIKIRFLGVYFGI